MARFNQATGSIRLTGVGQTKIEFQYDGRKAEIAIAATASANPDKLVIEPATVDLAVGSTARLKVFGEYKDGTRVDLDRGRRMGPAERRQGLRPRQPGRGPGPGQFHVAARYRGGPDAPYVEAAATVNVAQGDFQSIEVGVDPPSIGVGLSGNVHIDGVGADGKHYNLLGILATEDRGQPQLCRARCTARPSRASEWASGKLAATFGSGPERAACDFAVALPRPFVSAVHPESLDLAVDEIADIAYISPDRSPVHLSCSKAGIVDITADNRLIGRAVGDTQVTVDQSGKTLGTVAVTVTKADFQGMFFDPGSQVVEVDDTMHPRVFAMVAGSDPPRNAEIAPDWIATEKQPAAEFAGSTPRRSS